MSPSRQAPCWPGAGSGTSSYLSLPRMCSRRNIPTLGGRLRPATDARGAAAGPLPGARLAPPATSLPGRRGPGSHPRRLPSTFAPLFALVARLGPPLRRRCSVVTTTWGDVCSAPGHLPPSVGGRGGTCSLPGKRHVGPVQKGNGVGLVPISRCPGCARGATFQCQ